MQPAILKLSCQSSPKPRRGSKKSFRISSSTKWLYLPPTWRQKPGQTKDGSNSGRRHLNGWDKFGFLMVRQWPNQWNYMPFIWLTHGLLAKQISKSWNPWLLGCKLGRRRLRHSVPDTFQPRFSHLLPSSSSSDSNIPQSISKSNNKKKSLQSTSCYAHLSKGTPSQQVALPSATP